MTKKQKDDERDEAIKRLRELIKPGDTLVTVMRHRSASGMSRAIDVYMFSPGKARDRFDKTLRPSARVSWLWLSYNVAKACGFTFSKTREAIVIGGCGMDMGFQIVYTLGRVLFPKGGSLKHSPREAQERRAGKARETDGGYLLSHRWLG